MNHCNHHTNMMIMMTMTIMKILITKMRMVTIMVILKVQMITMMPVVTVTMMITIIIIPITKKKNNENNYIDMKMITADQRSNQKSLFQ